MDAPFRSMYLSSPSEDQNGNDMPCPKDSSLDSLTSSNNFTNSSKDNHGVMEMPGCCNSEITSVSCCNDRNAFPDNSFISADREQVLPSEIPVEQSNASILDYMKTNIENWNQNMALVITTGLQNGNAGSDNGNADSVESGSVESSDRVSESSPDSADRESFDPGSYALSRGSSIENGGSVSSGEMVLRGNSFLLHESDQPLSISFLEKSIDPSDVPSDMALLSGMLPDVCEGLHANTGGENVELPPSGSTFIRPKDQTFVLEGNIVETPPAPQHRTEEGKSTSLLNSATTRHESLTPVQQRKIALEVEKLQCFTGGSTQSLSAEGKTFFLSGTEDLDTSCNAQTSTPVQSVSNKTFCLLSLTESPLMREKGDVRSPLVHAAKEQQGGLNLKSVGIARTPLTKAAKSHKVEIKTFPKPDFRNVKSKVVSRPPNPSKQSSQATLKVTLNHSNQVTESQTMKTSHSSHLKSPLAKTATSGAPKSTVMPVKSVPKREQSTKGTKRPRSSTCQEKSVVPISRPRRWSESACLSKTSGDTPDQKESRVIFSAAQSSTTADIPNQNVAVKHPGRKVPSKEDRKRNGSLDGQRGYQKISLVAAVSKPAESATCEWSKGKFGPQPSPGRAGGAPSSRDPAANLRPPPSKTKQKPGSAGKDGSSNTDMPLQRSKVNTPRDNQKMRLTEGPCDTVAVGTSSKPTLNTGKPPIHAHMPGASSRLPVKSQAPHKSPSKSSYTAGQTKQDCTKPCSGILGRTPSNKTTGPSVKLRPLPSRSTPSVGTGCKGTASSSQGSAKSLPSPLKPRDAARPVRPTGASSVDKNKPKASSRNQQQPQANGHPDLVPPESKPQGVDYYRALCEKKTQAIHTLKNTLISNNRRFEAIAMVVQHLHAEHEEAMKQRRELSQELITLREELVSSTHSCERLEQEKEELRKTFDGVLKKVQEQHQSDLADLEDRLKTFYSAEWEKVHQAFQEEANKCKAQMEQQLEDLRSKHETLRKELEAAHNDKMESLKLQYEESLQDLSKKHEAEIQKIDNTLKETEATLSNQIEDLVAENNSLNEKLKTEEERRKELAERSQKDSHTLYLEQELESLKVVLDIKNKQIHQQDKKLMQMDKLLEKNVKLDECLKKVQQENEDLKARMDKHAALSRQLSTEQAALQESLQKESKVNKRLSMENEELLWKLHNGDLSSPRKLSPSSPSMSIPSPQNSGVFSSPTVSPR
ncbi:microtubule-associated tumor suppressor 1 homolog A isoform X1 [Chanos chanos]|uniref:Microtubule-associated tumor suppressor 1 homolog A isoform X1 n=1 Tax=Chanos chanos TaxID=29144 RepID=A0A6J2X155_CHACN|nr:microtubule-associated tumor suppressor 1-like isoform X1 [Chanos chanos]